MNDTPIRFDDGAAYEEMMGVWSRLAGKAFLDWLQPRPGLRWIDVGCGNGAFTELLVERCAPRSVVGVDPSEGQLRFARERHTAGVARFEQGDAMHLPGGADAFEAGVMALVIFFVPDPAAGLAELTRVVAPGGEVSAYVWDVLEPGGFPLAPLQNELRALGVPPILPPSAEASRAAALRDLWTGAGLLDVRTTEITVTRTFASFDAFWRTVEIALGMSPASRGLPAEMLAGVRERLRAKLPTDAEGRVAYPSRANAVAGRKPG